MLRRRYGPDPRLLNVPLKEMPVPHLLHLDSSAGGDASRSRAVTAAFAQAWRSRGADYTIAYRDLHRHALPHLADAELHYAPRLRRADAVLPSDAEALQQELIAELVTADVLLVGAPMYNYSLPSSLKAWLDHIHVLGVTATFDEPTQPMAGHPAIVVASRGAYYGEGSPTPDWDHAVPVLEILLGSALGMIVTVLVVSRTLSDRLAPLRPMADQAARELADATEEAIRLAGELC
jgi:FMN-dependent NADH-azoreductase